MKKRILTTLLAMALIVSAFAFAVSAANYTQIVTPNIIYDANGDGDYTDAGDTAANTITMAGTKTLPNGGFTSSVKVESVTPDGVLFSGINTKLTIYYKTSATEKYTAASSVVVETSSTTNGEYLLTGLIGGTTYDICVIYSMIDDTAAGNKYAFAVATNKTAAQIPNSIQITMPSLIDNGSKWPAPTGLSIVDNKLSGAVSGTVYEYAKVTPGADTPIGTYSDLSVSNTTFTAGLWAVRVKAGNSTTEIFQASDSVILYSRGAKVGTFSLENGNATALEQGAWTLVSPDFPTTTFKATPSGGSDPYTHASVMEFYLNRDGVNEKDLYMKSSSVYYMADDEIIPAEDFFSFTIEFGQTVNGLIDNLSDTNFTVPGRVIFHTYGGSEDSYEVAFDWKYGKSITIDLSSVSDRDGYIYMIEIDLWDEENNPDFTYTVNSSTYTYQLIKFSGGLSEDGTAVKTIKYSARGVHAKPELKAEGSSVAGKYVIKGFDPALDYMMSTNNKDFTAVEDGVSYITVSATGNYWFYVVENAEFAQSPSQLIRIAGARPAMTGLTLDEATMTVSGFDTSSYYVEWAAASVGTTKWNTKVNDADITLEANGLYMFRYQGDGGTVVSGAPQYIYIRGNDVGTIAYKFTKETEYAGHTGGFLPGYWTTTYGGTYNASNLVTAGYSVTQANYKNAGFMYQLTPDEIFPINEISSFGFSFSLLSSYNYFPAPYPALLRIYVAGADVDFYDIPVDLESGIGTADIASLWSIEVSRDENFTPQGYVTGFRVYLFNPNEEHTPTIIEGSTTVTPNNYLQMNVEGKNMDDEKVHLDMKKRVDMGAIRTVQAVLGYAGNDCGEIINLEIGATYQIAEANRIDSETFELTGEWGEPFTATSSSIAIPAGDWAIRTYFKADDPKYVSSDAVCVTVLEADPDDGRASAKVPKVLLPEDVTYADVDYVFDIESTNWINRLTIENIVATTPDATLVFEADDYRYTVKASDIDLSLSNAHYFDMKVTFDGESEYDRMYSKMAALADEDELVLGIHFESTTGYFFETAVFEINLGEKLDGLEVDLRSFNERVNRLRSEETVVVEGGWATFETFGADYVITSAEYAEAMAE